MMSYYQRMKWWYLICRLDFHYVEQNYLVVCRKKYSLDAFYCDVLLFLLLTFPRADLVHGMTWRKRYFWSSAFRYGF